MAAFGKQVPVTPTGAMGPLLALNGRAVALSNVCSSGKSGRIRDAPLFPLVTQSGRQSRWGTRPSGMIAAAAVRAGDDF